MKHASRMLSQLLKSFDEVNEKIVFIFVGDSLLHLAILKAYNDFQISHGINSCGIVCNTIPSNRKPQFTQEDISELITGKVYYLQDNYNVTFNEGLVHIIDGILGLKFAIHRYNIAKSKKTISNNEIQFIHISASNVKRFLWSNMLNTHRTIIDVPIDEGIGSYTQDSKGWKSLNIANTTNPFYKIGKIIRSIMFDSIIERQDEQISSIVSKYPMMMFIMSPDEGVIVNNKIKPYMINAFYTIGKKRITKLHNYKDTVVIILNNIFYLTDNIDIEINLINNVINAIGNNFKILIRPHPRATDLSHYNQLGVEIDDNLTVPFEALVAVSDCPPAATIGFTSTTQIICNAYWNVPAITLYRIMIPMIKGLDRNARFQHFISSYNKCNEVFSKYIYNIDTIDNISYILNSHTIDN